MKKIWTVLAVLGFALLFTAASTSDAGVLSFGWVVFMVLGGVACLVFSWTGIRSGEKGNRMPQKIRPVSLTEKGCSARRAG